MLKGLYLTPNIAQNATQTLMDDTLFLIGANTATGLTTTTGNITSIASAGDNYRLVLYLDNFEVRGKARLNFGSHYIVAREGDLTSGNTNTFVQDGEINAGTVDVNGAMWTNTANAAGTITRKCAANFACP